MKRRLSPPYPANGAQWSPDGAYLAVPRPGRDPAVDIIRTDTGKRVHIFDHAILPAWSPSGARCARTSGRGSAITASKL